MPYTHTSCQLERANDGDSRQKSTPQDGTQCPNIAPACQWITTTSGRIATDGHTWLTAFPVSYTHLTLPTN